MAKWAVCPRCGGEGQHTNPAIDGNGITADEMYELGDDFREDYLSGVYDIPCERCHGNQVVPACQQEDCKEAVEDIEEVYHCYAHLTEQEAEDVRDHYEYLAEVAAELRAGC